MVKLTNKALAERYLELKDAEKIIEAELKTIKADVEDRLQKGSKLATADFELKLEAGSRRSPNTKQMVLDRVLTQELLDSKYTNVSTFNKIEKVKVAKK